MFNENSISPARLVKAAPQMARSESFGELVGMPVTDFFVAVQEEPLFT